MIYEGDIACRSGKVPNLQFFFISTRKNSYSDAIAVEIVVAGDIVNTRLNRFKRLADGFASSGV